MYIHTYRYVLYVNIYMHTQTHILNNVMPFGLTMLPIKVVNYLIKTPDKRNLH